MYYVGTVDGPPTMCALVVRVRGARVRVCSGWSDCFADFRTKTCPFLTQSFAPRLVLADDFNKKEKEQHISCNPSDFSAQWAAGGGFTEPPESSVAVGLMNDRLSPLVTPQNAAESLNAFLGGVGDPSRTPGSKATSKLIGGNAGQSGLYSQLEASGFGAFRSCIAMVIGTGSAISFVDGTRVAIGALCSAALLVVRVNQGRATNKFDAELAVPKYVAHVQ